jgi:hypothetical protein
LRNKSDPGVERRCALLVVQQLCKYLPLAIRAGDQRGQARASRDQPAAAVAQVDDQVLHTCGLEAIEGQRECGLRLAQHLSDSQVADDPAARAAQHRYRLHRQNGVDGGGQHLGSRASAVRAVRHGQRLPHRARRQQ